MKIIHLVLYSNNKEYDQMYHLTRKYYTKFSNVTTIYYHFKDIVNDYEFNDDILFIKGNETYTPGILDKTIKAFQYINDHDFDYMIRSNISTIVEFDNLIEYLQHTPIQYGSGLNNRGDHFRYASGTSIIFSKDALTQFLNKKQHLCYNLIDDVSIGLLMNDHLPTIEQHYIPNKFIFIPNVKNDQVKLLSILSTPYIFYRNRQDDRTIDVQQMEFIIQHLQQ